MAKVSIPLHDGWTVDFDTDHIERWAMPNDVVETGVSPEGYVRRELGEHTHLQLTFKREHRPVWVEREVQP